MAVDPELPLVGEAFLAFLRLVDPPHTFNVVENDTTRYLINGAVWLHPDLQLGGPVTRNLQDKLYEKLTDIYMHLFELLRQIWGDDVFSIPVPELAVISRLDENECSTAILHVNSLLFGALIQLQTEYTQAYNKMDSRQKTVLKSILKKYNVSHPSHSPTRHPAVFYRIWKEVTNSRSEIQTLKKEVDDVNDERRRSENALQIAEDNNETRRNEINGLEDQISELEESLKKEGAVSLKLLTQLQGALDKARQLTEFLADRLEPLFSGSREAFNGGLEELAVKLTDSTATLERANTALQVKYRDGTKALRDMTGRCALLGTSLAEAQPVIENAVEARDAVAQLRQKLQTAQEEAEILTGRLEELQNQVAQGSHTDTPYAPSLAEETAIKNRTAIEELQTENERLRSEVLRLTNVCHAQYGYLEKHRTQSRQASVAVQRSTSSDRKMVYEDQEDTSHSILSLPLNVGEASEPAERSDRRSSRSSSDLNDRSITRDGVLVEDPSSEEPQDDEHQKQSSCSSPSFDVNDQGSIRESDEDQINEPNMKNSMLPFITDLFPTDIQQGILNYIQDLESTLEATQNTVEHLETIRKDENKASVRRVVELVSERTTSVNRIRQLEDEKRDLQAELEAEKRLQANVSEERQSQMEALETTLQEAKESKSQMEAEKRDLLTNILEQQKQMEALKTTLEAAKESKSELEAKQRNVQVSVTKQQSAIKSLQAKLHVEQEARSQQEETLRVCEKELKQLKQLKRSAASNASTDRIENLDANVIKVNAQKRKLEDKVAQQKGHIEDLENERSALVEELE
ncbi:hypothetical protein C8R47DRAFT_1221312 [Mycena vitilis]|nr:hypothetical protein C8R47DRAFT_1221312 [Mycena vitilis]